MQRVTANWHNELFVGWLVAILALLVLVAVLKPEPLPPLAPTPDFVVMQPGDAPQAVITVSADQRTLTVTKHARRDLLVCLRGDCRLVEEWLGR